MTVISLRRILQLPAFCGPASLEIVLSQHGLRVHQKAVVKAAHVTSKHVEIYGMRLDQLALAVRKLAPKHVMWAKRNATAQDIHTLVNTYNLAVGIEWQGVWTDAELWDPRTQTFDDDVGHYSVVTGINLEEKKLTIQDPDYYYYAKNREFDIETFEKRWFDTNVVGEDAPEEAKEWMQDYHVLFVVAPQNTAFEPELGLQKVRIAPTYKKKTVWERLVKFFRFQPLPVIAFHQKTASPAPLLSQNSLD